ncbi:hypothetical protein CEE44_03160 [Candidatus Woesearchaeota archaeon B3_Woes]|nr:MAG: hypothetical protein CEE44_03160 [Candidatus Woesearchaeota archaeon B3_Woes]
MNKNPKKNLRIAIIHDDFSLCGGGEKLVAILAKGLSKKGIEVDIITYNFTEEPKKIIPKGIKIKTIINKKYPFHDHNVRKYLFSKLNLKKKYDLFIFSGYFCLYASKINKPNILYCHNVRKPYLSTQKRFEEKPNKRQVQAKLDLIDNSFLGKSWTFLYKIKNKFIKKKIPRKISEKIELIRFLFAISPHPILIKYAIKPLTEEEEIRKEINYIQKIIVNSLTIKKDAKEYYKRESIIIHPPIETKKFHYKKNKNFWISINRIDPHKRVELQLKAFSKMPNEKLYIIGHIQNQKYYEFLKKIKPNNVKFLGVINEDKLIKKLSECKGMVFTAKKEDFGMAPVEAMASGKPVIAPNEGGCKETIINEKTGILINNINEDKIIRAVEKINKNPEKYKNACLRQARKFDVEVFIKKMTEEIRDSLVQ